MQVKTIFIVEDDTFFAKVFEKRLRSIGDYAIHIFESSERALAGLSELKPNIIFLDHLLKGVNGVDALPVFKEQSPNSEIVVVSGQRDVKVLAQAIQDGATKYFMKDALLMHHTVDFIKEIEKKGTDYVPFWQKLMKSYSK